MKKSERTNNRQGQALSGTSSRKQRFKLKPSFWTHSPADTGLGINFKRKWRLLVFFTTVMVLTPLFIMMAVDARLSIRTLKTQTEKSMSQLVRAGADAISQRAGILQNITRTPNTGADLKKHLNWTDIDTNLDLFLVDQSGNITTSSQFFRSDDDISRTISKQVQGEAGSIKGLKTSNSDVTAVYANISGSPLVLVAAKQDRDVASLYFLPRIRLLGYLMASILVIILTILCTTTYLVGRIHQADKKRIDTLHRVESANKLAAIGRLASGVAHEINNPLAIINEKNGLIMDILSSQESMTSQQRLIALAGDVTGAVQRCGRITRRLLDFARHVEPSVEVVNIEQIIRQILSFYEKEAERLRISIHLDFPDSIPDFETDKGSLQQIFLNLIENAFDAMKDSGKLSITAFYQGETLTVCVADTGAGIKKEERHKIFEPFYTSKSEMWKTGLGLSITYGLVKEIDGEIMVKSTEGKGSEFILTLPVKTVRQSEGDDE